MQNQKKLLIAIMSVLGSGFVWPLYAEDTKSSAIEEGNSSSLENVMVTVQKRLQNMQEVPVAITAINSDDIERLNASNLGELQFATPNLTVSTNNRSNARIGLRGVSDNSRNPGYDNRVSVYVDGIYVGRSAAANQATLDLERIEVLRGPQGTLFGKNTVAGAINMTTKRPDGQFNGYLQTSIGNYSHKEVTGLINGALVDEQLYAKLMVNDTQRDGYIRNLYDNTELNGLDNQALRLQLRWLSEKTEVNFNVDYGEQNAEFHGREAINDSAAPELFEVAFNKGSLQYVELKGISAIVEHELENGMSFNSLTGFRETNYQNSADEDYRAIDFDGTTSPFADAESAIGEESEQFSQELRLASVANDDYDYVIGLYYFDQTNTASTSAGVGNNIVSVTVPATVDVTSYATFIHGNYRLSENLQFTGGLRYTSEEKSIVFSITDSTGLFTNGSLTDSRDSDNFSPRIGLNYFASDDVMYYTSFARAFKSGGWNADFVESLDGLGFDDEEVDSFELGVKTTLLNGSGRLNISVFQSDYSNFQVQQFVVLPNDITDIILTNAGEVSAQGLELDFNYAINEQFKLWATYGYTDATFDSFKNGGGDGVDYDGNELPDAPKNSYSLGIEGYFSLSDSLSLITQFDYSHRDDFFTNPSNADSTAVKGYDRLNARIGIEPNDHVWSVYLWVKNLLDSDDQTYRSRSFLGIDRAVFMEPRMAGVSFKYNFGDF